MKKNKKYDEFLKKISDIEENYKCKECNNKTLVSISFTEPIFMCTKCGTHIIFKGVK